MQTIHAADRVLDRPEGADADAVAVDGGLIVAAGPYERLVAERPQARVRRWPGLLLPGLRHPQAVPLLEGAYHPDPREAGELGTEPLTGDALEALAMDDTRWGASARRGLQRLMAHGVTALDGPFTHPAVRTAVARSGLGVRVPLKGSRHEVTALALDPLVHFPLNALLDGDLSVGAPAAFAVFDVPVGELPDHALRLRGTGSCVATVLGGRLVHRAR